LVSKKQTSRVGRRSRVLFVPLVLFIAVGLQVPIVWALGRLGGHFFPIVALTTILTGAFVWGLVGPRSVWQAPGNARLYLVIWPFFIWWTIGLLFALVAPFALGAGTILHTSTNGALAAGMIIAALGAAGALRQRPRISSRDIFISGLPPAFDGYRVVQISDLHCGPFVQGRRVAEWVAAVNHQKPDLVAVTGDFIASGSAFVPVVAAALAKLSARDGVFASMGNHDYFTDGEALVDALEGAGMSVLRNRGIEIRRAGAAIYLAGVDDTWTRRHDVDKALSGRTPGIPVVLLAHDPALFPEAARHGVDLTLSGHTHGGQLGLPFVARRLNLARLMTRFTSGLYRSGSSTLYVNRGLGTTGPPVRLGVAPEIAVLTLRRGAEPGLAIQLPELRAAAPLPQGGA
jgi:predicted MPP superfamily phosphohydrolase